MDAQSMRAAALIAAAIVTSRKAYKSPRELSRYADCLVPFIDGTAAIAVAAAVDGNPVPLLISGETMSQTVNATVDNNTVTLVAASEDDHNNPTSDQLTWTNDDTSGTVGTYADNGDTYTVTLAHAEGTVNITVDDPSAPDLSPTVVQLVVGPGATSQINVTATVE
jgi:hypothetical protein